MNVGIRDIGVYLPVNSIDNIAQGSHWDVEPNFIQNKIGNIRLTRKSESEDTTDIAKFAVENLFQKHETLKNNVQCLVIVTQNPDGHGLPHSSAILHDKLDLPQSCAVFDISLGCSGYVQGIMVAKGFMESQGLCNGLLVTSDPYSKIIDPEDRDTALLFGDGATATWLSNEPTWNLVSSDFGIVSNKHQALSVMDGKLKMKGRDIYNFAATYVPQSVEKVLDRAGFTIEQIDLVLLHQGSRFIVETLAKRLCSEGKTPFASTYYGNTISSSLPIMLAELDMGAFERVILSGFGVGLAWATCILEINKAIQ
jgi:3-oxoacyl-[acyl-carrier-protein] synthase III